MKSYDQLRQLTKVRLVNTTVFPVVVHGCESWTIMNTKCQRIVVLPAIPLLGIHTKETRSERDTCYPNVHHSTVYNSQDTEAT